MPITREFFGFDQPPLQAAADYLIRRYRRQQQLDMSAAIVVLPGGRAARRLLELLVQQAEELDLLLTPPVIETVGRLPEQLYRTKRPFADDVVQQLSWAQALLTTEPAMLQRLVPDPPDRAATVRWVELGALLQNVHTELAADGLDFAAVARLLRDTGDHAEAERWEACMQMQSAYLRILDDLQLWDIQTARLVAIRQRECATDCDIFLVAAVDMNISLRQMLDQVADRVTAMIFAPSSWGDRFDEHGCLIAAVWEHASIELGDTRIHLADDPADQADVLARCLAALNGRYRADEISIGLPDERITPHVQRQLEQCGISSRSAVGIHVAETRPYRLLEAAATLIGSHRYAALAALVRHPDVANWLQRKKIGDDWLEQMDAAYNEHLPHDIRATAPFGANRAATRVRNAIRDLLKPLDAKPQPLADWSPAIAELLRAIYGGAKWNRDDDHHRIVLSALEKIRDVLCTTWGSIPPALMPTVEGQEAIDWLLRLVQSEAIRSPGNEAAIELLGWLELPLDDAPAAIVCSFNEGFVPSSANADLFLPNALRVRLGMLDNQRRYARDAYALSVLAGTRSQLDLIVGRRNADDDPLTPSRLLFACDDPTLADRVRRLFRPTSPRRSRPPLAGKIAATRERSTFVVPQPQPLTQPITALAVTSFRSYLACPYRFYLSRVLGLQGMDDVAEELDGAMFGTALHETLRRWGESDRRDSTDASEITEFLDQSLDEIVVEMFGKMVLPAVRLQLEQLRNRLQAFAHRQAEWAHAGWRIEQIEVPRQQHESATFIVDGQPLILRGRIDRIDVHHQTGERAILDYKSSDAGERPERVHQKSDEWIDLQLPLYRHLLPSIGIAGPVRLGFIVLPKDTSQTAFLLADWTDADLRAADEVAAEVVRNIRAEKFWPPADPPSAYADEFAAICQDAVFERQFAPC